MFDYICFMLLLFFTTTPVLFKYLETQNTSLYRESYCQSMYVELYYGYK